MNKPKKESIAIKHQNRIKKFRWKEFDSAAQLAKSISSTFDIHNKTIKGLLDPDGKLFFLKQLICMVRKPLHP